MTIETIALPAPLTVSEIDTVREQKRYQKAKEMRMYALRKQGFSVGELLSVIVMAIGTIVGVFGWACGHHVPSMLVGLALVAWLEAWRRRIILEQRFVSFEDVPPAHCQGLLDMLQDLPDGQRFRHAVLEQGRAFTMQDWAVVEAAHDVWATQKQQRASEESCKTLYGISA